MGRILIREGTFELSCTNLKLGESAPLSIEIYQLDGRLTRTFHVGSLYLGTPVEITDLTVEDETRQTEIKRVRVVSFRVLSLIL